jgi:hypothetical protein
LRKANLHVVFPTHVGMNHLRVVANWEQRRIPHIRGVKPKKNPPRRVIFPHIRGLEPVRLLFDKNSFQHIQ